MAKPLRILGIDPGTRHVGYGIIESTGSSLRHIHHGCVNTRGDELADRLVQIHHGLQEMIALHQPTIAAIETVFAGENIRTAIAIGEGRGVALLSAAENGLAVFGYEPAVVKKAVAGSGRASKKQIQEMVRVLLGLKEIPSPDHAADALALAITHAHRQKFSSIIPPRPKRRRR